MLPWGQTNDKSENGASQQIDQGLLTFAINNHITNDRVCLVGLGIHLHYVWTLIVATVPSEWA